MKIKELYVQDVQSQITQKRSNIETLLQKQELLMKSLHDAVRQIPRKKHLIDAKHVICDPYFEFYHLT